MSNDNRPDLADFIEAISASTVTDLLAEFIGIATAGGDSGEDLAVFRMVPNGGCLLANNRRSYRTGRDVPTRR